MLAFAAPLARHIVAATSPQLRCASVLSARPTVRHHARARARSTMAATVPTATDAMYHFVYRVGDLARTREFLSIIGLKVLRERDIPEQKYTNVFFGAGTESKAEHCSLELTYNYGVEEYKIGDGFGHFGVAVPDVGKVVETLRDAGFTISREPGLVKGGQSYMAFVQDPTGYRFELLQREQRDPICQVTLRVRDLEKAVAFYTAMGMHEVRRRESEGGRYTNVKMGYGPELDSTLLQLTYNWDREEPYDCGDGYGQIAVRATKDVYETAKIMEQAGFEASRAPGPVPGIGTKIVAYRDPDNWKTVVVDSEDFEKELV